MLLPLSLTCLTSNIPSLTCLRLCLISLQNMYSLPQEQIAEMKRKMKIMTNQVNRLRDEITGKDQALAMDQQENKRLEKDNEAFKVQQLASLPLAGLLHWMELGFAVILTLDQVLTADTAVCYGIVWHMPSRNCD